MTQSSNSSVENQNPDSLPRQNSLRRLPAWSKILIAMTSFTLVFSVYFVYRFTDFAHDFAVNATNPAKIAIVASRIARFPQPLPEGYQFESAYSFPSLGQDVLSISHKPDGQTINFISNPYMQENAKSGLERAQHMSLGGRALFLPFSQEKSRGELTIGDETMPYIVGEFGSKETTGQIVEGLIGCLSLKKEGKTIFINALPGEGSSYNLKVTTDLLQSIEGFEGTK